jgi:hypothetical protein
MRGLNDELVGLALSISFIGHCTDEPDDAQLPKVGVETTHDDNASRTYHGSFSPSLNGETPSLSKLTVECLSFLDFFFLANTYPYVPCDPSRYLDSLPWHTSNWKKTREATKVDFWTRTAGRSRPMSCIRGRAGISSSEPSYRYSWSLAAGMSR